MSYIFLNRKFWCSKTRIITLRIGRNSIKIRAKYLRRDVMKEPRDIYSHRSMDIAVMVRIVTETKKWAVASPTVCKMAARFVLSFTFEFFVGDVRKLAA